jgi:hypothetical protein
MAFLDKLSPAFIRGGYRQCFYLELHCSTHGAIRVAVETEPAQQHPCPLCGSTCNSAAIGRGMTRQQIPAFEVVCKVTKYANVWKKRQQRSRKALLNA